MTEERNIKTENNFSVLQEEETEPVLEEEQSPPINKIDKDEKKVIQRKREYKKNPKQKEE